MKKFSNIAVLTTASILASCGTSDDDYQRGHGDGFAVGYNTACQVRATQIAADWSDADYSEGYAFGVTDGIIACNNDREAEDAE